MTTLTLPRKALGRLLGSTVDFTDLHSDFAHQGGVPWQEFVKIHADGTSVYACAGSHTSMAIARVDHESDPVEFLLHADDARELLTAAFKQVAITVKGDDLDADILREDGRIQLRELATRPPGIFPRANTLIQSAFDHAGAEPLGLTVTTLTRLTDAVRRFGRDAGLTLYPRDDAKAPILATYGDELLLICGTADISHRARVGRNLPVHIQQTPTSDFWPTAIAGGAW